MIRLPYMLWKGRHSPMIPVVVKVDDRSINTTAYLDTGATYSVFHTDYADRLGLKLNEGNMVEISIGDGSSIHVFLHEVLLKVEDLEFMARIGFSDELGIGLSILGRDYVMDEYVICFDGHHKEILWKLPAEV